jgi:prevent-host-death family protein
MAHGTRTADVQEQTGQPQTLEVGIRRLRDEASALIERVCAGDRVVITRYRRPVAILLSVEEAFDFLLAYGEEFVAARLEAHAVIAK